ncbi:hypothetical protein EV177_010751, partial [Coemansia sp. RSA 1804]
TEMLTAPPLMRCLWNIRASVLQARMRQVQWVSGVCVLLASSISASRVTAAAAKVETRWISMRAYSFCRGTRGAWTSMDQALSTSKDCLPLGHSSAWTFIPQSLATGLLASGSVSVQNAWSATIHGWFWASRLFTAFQLHRG